MARRKVTCALQLENWQQADDALRQIGEDRRDLASIETMMNERIADAKADAEAFQSTPLTRGETRLNGALCADGRISIHSPHTRGDSISLQKSIRIYVSLHNKTMIHRFSELYKPLFCGAKPDIRGAKPTGKP